MYILKEMKRKSVKVRIDGKDKAGKNTSRQIIVVDADVDLIAEIIRKAIEKSAGGGRDSNK